MKTSILIFSLHKCIFAVAVQYVLESSCQTVESLASGAAHAALASTPGERIERVSVRVAKPSALMFAASAEVAITRTHLDFLEPVKVVSAFQHEDHVAAIALGSNIGDRVQNIERALIQLESAGLRVVDTSFMYESVAMYVEDQPKFTNAACLVSSEPFVLLTRKPKETKPLDFQVTTALSPQALLSLLKEVEASVGRTPTFRNGPRVIDLDIILYDDLVILHPGCPGTHDLQIPHVAMQEREFVLRPLAE